MDDIRKAMRLITRMAQTYTARAMQGSDLSPAQMQALRIISFHPGISQQGLAERLGIDKAAVARIISALESKGTITRGADPQDGRVKRLNATPQGVALKDAIITSETGFFEYLFSDLEPEELAMLSRVLSAALQKANAARQDQFAALLGQDGPGQAEGV